MASILVATGTSAVALGAAYTLQRPTAADFGRVPHSLRVEMLVGAAVSLLITVGLLVHVGLLASPIGVLEQWAACGALVAYTALQIAFLPLARAAMRGSVPRSAVRVLLAVAVVPLLVLLVVAVRSATTPVEAVVLGGLASVPVLHAIVNDAVLYGALF